MFDTTYRPYDHGDSVTLFDEHPNQMPQLTWIPTLGTLEGCAITRQQDVHLLKMCLYRLIEMK